MNTVITSGNCLFVLAKPNEIPNKTILQTIITNFIESFQRSKVNCILSSTTDLQVYQPYGEQQGAVVDERMTYHVKITNEYAENINTNEAHINVLDHSELAECDVMVSISNIIIAIISINYACYEDGNHTKA